MLNRKLSVPLYFNMGKAEFRSEYAVSGPQHCFFCFVCEDMLQILVMVTLHGRLDLVGDVCLFFLFLFQV
jgi:hypothetical protein